MNNILQETYERHNTERNRLGFSILEHERAALFRQLIGTGKRVLDLGCRDGTLTRHFTGGNDVTGADVDMNALAKVSSELGIKTVQFDFNASAWPLESESFDVVVAAEVIEHLFFPEGALKRIARHLKHGGMLIGSVPNAFSLKCRLRYLMASKRGTPLADPMHINQFGWHEFGRLLREQYSGVRLHPLGRWPRLARLSPSLFAYGIGFVARRP